MDNLFLIWVNEVDKSDRVGGKKFSRLIDPIEEIAASIGFRCIQIIEQNRGGAPEDFWGDEKHILKNKSKKGSAKIIWQKLWLRFLKSIRLLDKNLSPYKLLDCREILKKYSPKLIVGIEIPQEVICIAKERKIKTIEILHGYGYTNKCLPSCMRERSSNLYPDYLVTLDSNSFNTLKSINGLERTMLTIHPLREVMTGLPSSRIAKEIENIKVDFIPKNRKIALISLNWGYFSDHPKLTGFNGILKNGLIHESLVEAVKKTEREVFWLIRFHPVHLGNPEKYAAHFHLLKELGKSLKNIEWEKSSETPLHRILPLVNYHVTMRSETTYDAASFGIPTLLLCPRLNDGSKFEYFKDLIGGGAATLGELNASKIIEWLRAAKFPALASDPNKRNMGDLLRSLVLEK